MENTIMHSITPSGKGRRSARLLSAAAVATAATLALAGCTGGGSSDSADSGGDEVLRIAVAAPPVSLDPALQNVDPINNWYIQLAYDPLIRLDNTGESVPDLAESWEYLDDQSTQFQLTIRDDVQFSDGTPLTAENVVASLQYMIDSGVNGATWLGEGTEVSAPDETTVLIETEAPNSQLPFLLSQRTHLGSVISPAGLEDPEALKSGSYGAGPYVLDADATIADDTYVFVANDNYWNPDKQHWDRIELKIAGNVAAALQAVQNGDADIMRGDVTTASAAGGLNVQVESAGLYGVGYLDRAGSVSEPIGDPLVRQALSYGINRDAVTQAVWGEFGTAGNDLTLPGFSGFTDAASESYAYDPEKAKELLAEAGYPDGFSFDMQTTNLSGADIAAQAIVQNWAEIGVTANLTVYSDQTQLINDTISGKYPVGIYFYGAQPQYLQSKSFFSGGVNQYNPFDSRDEQILASLATGDSSPDPAAQQEAYAAALERAIVDLVWFSNVAYTPSVMISKTEGLTGLEFSPLTASPDMAWEVAPSE